MSIETPAVYLHFRWMDFRGPVTRLALYHELLDLFATGTMR
jgi:hypothetical protein